MRRENHSRIPEQAHLLLDSQFAAAELDRLETVPVQKIAEGGGKDVFVHMTAVQAAGLRGLNEGQKVSFDVEADKRGPKAVNLKLV